MKKKILVLDDSRFMLQLITELLNSLNYDVTTFDNGRAALLEVTSNAYDLVITDLNMPSMDGIEFAKQVRSSPGCRFLPIIMVSSELDDDRISMAKTMGISTFLSKPIKEEQLKSILEIILNKRMTPRIPIRMKVLYKKSNDAKAEYGTSYTLNVSMGGLFLEAENPFPPGEKLDLELYLEEKHPPIACQARVAWTLPSRLQSSSAPPGMGLAFVQLREHQLQEFIKSGKWKYSR